VTTLTLLVYALAAGRIAIGLAPLLAAKQVSALLGFPAEHDTPTARLFARLFGIRDIGLGVMVWAFLPNIELLRWAFLFNALHDFGDICVIAVPLLRKQGIHRAALLSLGCAGGGLLCWLVTWWLSFRLVG
jgi:hypothetical protein